MSGTSFENPCPNCGQPATWYSDYKPFEHSSGECMYCGFYLNPKIGQMDLKTLNEIRKDFNTDNGYKKGDEEYLSPFKKLPKCDLNKIY